MGILYFVQNDGTSFETAPFVYENTKNRLSVLPGLKP